MTDQTSRRRKWDQEDNSSEPVTKIAKTETSNEEPIDPMKAASLAAARLNALYAIKKTTGSPTADTKQTGTPPPPPPTTNKEEFSKKIEINDLKNRYMLTRGATQSEIAQETGAEITTRGKYYPDANLATEKEPPLYLYISASTQESLDQAVSKVNDLIENAKVPTPGQHGSFRRPPHEHNNNNNVDDDHQNNGYSQYTDKDNSRSPYERPQRKFYEENVLIGIPEGPHYNVRAKIVGPQGAYVKHISSVTGCRIQVRGKGSGFYEQDTGKESEEPLYMHISTPRQEMLPKAVQLAKDLIGTIKEEVEQRNQSGARGYNRGYHPNPHHSKGNYQQYQQNYDYQGYGVESQHAGTNNTTNDQAYSAHDYSQYDYYGQQQYDPAYYNQYYQYYQQQPTGSSNGEQSSTPTSTGGESSPSYNSVPPPSQY
ncbi:uncharacterized protein BX664DRAFT_344079 [Halteromyces radiatus]|uniref:uncharacterized protein n=1 Tax=Halteromyces radiatus TaxID=101107 RepID=UPI00222082D1|nr:uncharacterized protein BX664DRAFT_344079 [Halteromyces radiatus]KAI8076844.1 hypothetical protein BX664DRAFT_344079 [Halteromyces radiatus]